MEITGFNSTLVTEDQTFSLKEVTSLTVSNYGQSDLYVIISNVRRVVPALDVTINIPYYFRIDGDGSKSNIEIKIEFDGSHKTQNAILDYRQAEQKKC